MQTLDSFTLQNELLPCPGLTIYGKYSKHLSDRQNNAQPKGSHKNCSLCGLVPSRKTLTEKNPARQRVGGEGRAEGLPTPNDKPSGRKEDGGDGANGAAAPLFSANLPHSSIYKHQLPQKSGCVKYQQRALPHGASDNETSHRALGLEMRLTTARASQLQSQFQTHPPHPAHGLQAS